MFGECSVSICVLHVTSVDDGFPLVDPALVRHGVEVAALGVSEGRQAGGARCWAADPVAPPLAQAVLPPVLRTAEAGEDLAGSLLSHPQPGHDFFFFLSLGSIS